MTISELKNRIEDLPDDMEVFIGERLTEEKYGRVNSTGVKKIDFYESPEDEDPIAKDTVFILSEY